MICRPFGRQAPRFIDRARSSVVLALVFALLAGSGVAAEPQAKPQEKSGARAKSAVKQPAQLPAGVRFIKDIPYVPDGDEAQRLDLYLPEQPADAPMPLIVHIHGGGWRAGSKSRCPLLHMVGRGYAMASVEYRFSQKALFPAQIQDCQAAIRWLRANSKRYNFDPGHVGVVGSSAGGHLVALLGTSGGTNAFAPIGGNEDQSDRVQAVCDFYGPTDFGKVMQQAADDKNVRNIFQFNTPSDPYSCLIGVSLDADKQKTDAVSPMHYVSADDPPILILHGTHDALVPYAQSTEFVKALKAQGVDALLQTLPGSGHGGRAFGKPEVIELITSFFDKHLGQANVEVKLVPEADLAVEPAPPRAKQK